MALLDQLVQTRKQEAVISLNTISCLRACQKTAASVFSVPAAVSCVVLLERSWKVLLFSYMRGAAKTQRADLHLSTQRKMFSHKDRKDKTKNGKGFYFWEFPSGHIDSLNYWLKLCSERFSCKGLNTPDIWHHGWHEVNYWVLSVQLTFLTLWGDLCQSKVIQIEDLCVFSDGVGVTSS